MFKKYFYLFISLSFLGPQTLYAFQPKEISSYFNGPTVSSVSSTGAQLSLSQSVLSGLTEEEKQNIYFQVYETNKVCIAIYPTPSECLPRKTEMGKLSVLLNDLKPNTSYTASYASDNTIRCITTPCPENSFESLPITFTTVKDMSILSVDRNMGFSSRGEQVVALQKILLQAGYMQGTATGYFGPMTLQAVKAYQKKEGIMATGFVGVMTRASLNMLAMLDTKGVFFEGIITEYNTGCFADGICSMVIDGKTIITTIGRSQNVVGNITGFPDADASQNVIGSRAKVYAAKTADGYTLYGDSSYYVHILPEKGKLVAGSIASGDNSALKGVSWVWQKTVLTNRSSITPKKTDAFTVMFDATSTLISGSTDCNRFFGTYTLASDGFLSISSIGQTRMYCENSQEGEFLDEISTVSRYSIDASSTLTFMLSQSSSTMYFLKK